jgi:hypothetical protein
MEMNLRIAAMIILTSALLGCPVGQRPFEIAQLCLGDQKNLTQFANILKSVAQTEGMTFTDTSASTERDLKAMGVKVDPTAPVISFYVGRKDGVGLGAGNQGLPNYQVAVGFSEGSNPSDAHRFADLVVSRLEKHWHVVFVPNPAESGALPLKNCNQQ